MRNDIFIPVLAYHEVNDKSERNKKRRSMEPSCLLDANLFKKHLNCIEQLNILSIIDLDINNQCYNVNSKREAPNGYVVLTFDDGHIGNFEYAFPMLKENNHCAIFFVCTDFIGKRNMMDWNQIKEMSDGKMSIQSHCVSHIPLETLSEKQMANELKVSKEIIQEKTGREVTALSLPNGSMHPKIFEEAKKAGYGYIFTSDIAYYRVKNNSEVTTVPRIPIPDWLSIEAYRNIVLKKEKMIKTWALKQKAKSLIKNAIGINNYRKIYRAIYRIEKIS